MWRREDAKRKEEFENPLLELKKGAAEITKVMEENGVQNLKVMPMVVFADNFQTPELYLGFSNSSFLFASSRRHIAPSGVPYILIPQP